MSRPDTESIEYLHSVKEYQASFIKDQAKRIHKAVDMLEEMTHEIDEDTILTKIEEVVGVLLNGKT